MPQRLGAEVAGSAGILPALSESFAKENIRPRFSRVLGRDEIYLANHSLGRPLDQTAADIREGVDLWYGQMDNAWEPWLAEMDRWRGNVARLIGAPRPDLIVPKTSAGQGLRAVLNAFPQERPVKVLTTRGEFDSIDFILKTYAHLGRADVTWIEPSANDGPVPVYKADDILNSAAFQAVPTGLIVVSLAFFGTGQILQNARDLIGAAHEKGWLVFLDLYHAAGVIPLDFDQLEADFGIGGSYKYLRGGPGACWLALGARSCSTPQPPSSVSRDPGSAKSEGPSREKTEEGGLRSLDTGWFAKKNTFGYQRGDTPEFADGGNGWLESTPPILMPYQARAGIEFVLETGVGRLREFSLRQQARMRDVFRRAGVDLLEPTHPDEFGAFSLLQHENAAEFSKTLKARGVNTDARGKFVRFGPDILNTDEEFEKAATIVAAIR